MAERKFDYANIADIYKKMQNITGNKGDASSIAGILEKMDKDVHDNVDVSDQAIYGDLGRQLLLDWENTSSNFDSFVNNFEKWSALVAKSAGDYQAFEQRVNGLKTDHPLGMTAVDANGKGLTSNYIDSSYYSTYTNENFENQASQLGELKEFNGASYIDTNMVLREEQRKTGAKWAFGLNTVSTVLSVVGGSGIVKAEAEAGKVIFKGTQTVTQAALPSGGTQLALPESTGASQASNSASAWAATDSAGNVVYGPGVDASSVANNASGAVSGASSAASGPAQTVVPDAVVNADGTVAAHLGNGPKAFAQNALLGAKKLGSSIANSSAVQTIGNGLNAAGNTIASTSSRAINSLGGLAGAHPNLVAGAGVATQVFSEIKDNKVTIDGTQYTANPYLSTILPSDQEENSYEENMFLYNEE